MKLWAVNKSSMVNIAKLNLLIKFYPYLYGLILNIMVACKLDEDISKKKIKLYV